MQQPPYDPQYVTPRRSMSPLVIFLIVIGGCAMVGVVVVIALAAVMLPVFAQAREAARKASCMSNEKQLATAVMMYMQDYDDRMPPASTWQDGTIPYVANTRVYLCPSAPGAAAGYAFNSLLDRRKADTFTNPAATPLLYDSVLASPNTAEPVQSFAARHLGLGNMAFADGHVQSVASAPPANAGLKAAGGKGKPAAGRR